MDPSISAVSPFPPATASARLGLQRSVQRLDAAADRIARSGLETAAPGGADAEPAASGVDLAGASVDVLLAQRAFAAQLRVLEAAAAMAGEATRIGQGPDAPRTSS